MTFDPVSPQIIGSSANVTCSLGDKYQVFEPSGNLELGGDCGISFTTDPAWPIGDYHVVECLSSVPDAVCYNATFDEAVSDPGFISSQVYTFNAPAIISTSTPTHIDYIYINGTSTDSVGNITNFSYNIFIPFFDYILVFTTLCFSILLSWFVYYMLYCKKY